MRELSAAFERRALILWMGNVLIPLVDAVVIVCLVWWVIGDGDSDGSTV